MGRLYFRDRSPNGHVNGKNHYRWKGGVQYSNGYRLILIKDHPKANLDGYVREHLLVAEEVLGKPLPLKASIHHIDGVKDNNKKSNIIICENEAYHQLLHQRAIALAECGFAYYKKCRYCGQYDDPANLYVPKRGMASHRECRRRLRREGLIK